MSPKKVVSSPSSETTTDNNNNNNANQHKLTGQERIALLQLCPRPTPLIYLNVAAACVILLGGIVGYLKANSKASVLVAFGFAATWLHSAFKLDQNSGQKLVNKRSAMLKKSANNIELARKRLQADIVYNRLYPTLTMAFASAAVTGGALVLLMCLRVYLMEGVRLKAPPIMASIIVGSLVCIGNGVIAIRGNSNGFKKHE